MKIATGFQVFKAHSVFFVASISTLKVLQRDIVILIQPLHHEWLKPSGIFRHGAFVRRNLLDMLHIKPLHGKVEIHVAGRLTKTMLLVLLEGILDVDS